MLRVSEEGIQGLCTDKLDKFARARASGRLDDGADRGECFRAFETTDA
jgi:hypothetical protein